MSHKGIDKSIVAKCKFEKKVTTTTIYFIATKDNQDNTSATGAKIKLKTKTKKPLNIIQGKIHKIKIFTTGATIDKRLN